MNKAVRSLLDDTLKEHHLENYCDKVGLNIAFRSANDFIDVLNKCEVKFNVLENEEVSFIEPYYA